MDDNKSNALKPCTFGGKCGNIDPEHRKSLYHPNPLPACKYGVNCNNYSTNHRNTFWHLYNRDQYNVFKKKEQEILDIINQNAK